MLKWTLPFALLFSACAQTTNCDYIDKTPTGDLPADLAGCWQTTGPDTPAFGSNPVLLVYQFYSDGTYRLIQPGDDLFGGGQVVSGNFTLTDGVLDLQNGTQPSHVQVTSTSLELTDDAINMRRALCRGYGFEHGQTCQ
jgi:hypothetical protein